MGKQAQALNVARDYYNSGDADNFYSTIWGGEDIHIGIYESEKEPIRAASRRTVEKMASRLEELGEGSRVLDLGAGYGGPARFLAKNYGCRVVALNLSEVENERNRAMNEEQGLGSSGRGRRRKFRGSPLRRRPVRRRVVPGRHPAQRGAGESLCRGRPGLER